MESGQSPPPLHTGGHNMFDQPSLSHEKVATGPNPDKLNASTFCCEVVFGDIDKEDAFPLFSSVGNEKAAGYVHEKAEGPRAKIPKQKAEIQRLRARIIALENRSSRDNASRIYLTPAPSVQPSSRDSVPLLNSQIGTTPPINQSTSDESDDSSTEDPAQSNRPTFYTKIGKEVENNDELRKLKEAERYSDDLIAFMSLTHGGLYDELKEHVENEKDNFFLIDLRDKQIPKSNFNTCIDIISGLFVGKAAAITHLLLPFYVLHEGIYWKVHGIHRLNKRVWAEFQVVRNEVRRMCRSKNDIFEILREAQPARHLRSLDTREYMEPSSKIQQIAQCVESRLVYTYTRHGEGYNKHIIQRAADSWEGSLYLLVREFDSD